MIISTICSPLVMPRFPYPRRFPYKRINLYLWWKYFLTIRQLVWNSVNMMNNHQSMVLAIRCTCDGVQLIWNLCIMNIFLSECFLDSPMVFTAGKCQYVCVDNIICSLTVAILCIKHKNFLVNTVLPNCFLRLMKIRRRLSVCKNWISTTLQSEKTPMQIDIRLQKFIIKMIKLDSMALFIP